MPQVTIDQALQIAVRHQQAGRLQEAEQICRQILAQLPDHAEALHLLGVIAQRVGRHDIATDLIHRAITLNPNLIEAYGSLGVTLQATGQLNQAVAAYRRAIALRPGYAQAHNNLGVVLKDLGQIDAAIAECREAIACNPNLPEAHSNLGVALAYGGRHGEAIAAYCNAIALRPNYVEAHNNLGLALAAYSDFGNTQKERGQLDQAIAIYRQVIALRPANATAHNNLGVALNDKGQLDDAIAAYREAIALMPNQAEPHNNLGNTLREKGNLYDAVAAFRGAIALRPDYAEAHYNLGNALRDIGQLDEAIVAYRQAIRFKPDLPEAHGNLGNLLADMGRLDDAIAAHRREIALRPDHAAAHSNLVLRLHYHPACDAGAIAEEHRRWNRIHVEPLKRLIQPHANDRSPGRRLRIGYVSPDFRDHAVAPIVLPLLACRDREMFEVFCYAEVQTPDAMTERFRAQADDWRSTVGASDEQLAGLIRQDRIDILVDLAGHTAGGRLLVFARKPAPVQIAHIGYPNTTGLSTMDYRMTDAYADPPGPSDTLHSEQLIRLPRTNWIYQPPEKSPDPDHCQSGGPITFGCFNNFAKVTEPMLVLWGRILTAVPGSRLLLKAQGLSSSGTRQRVRELLIKEGIDPARLELRGWEPRHGGHLALYNRVDIALDPFPYHGTTTTCEALWMGVPVITLAGQTHVSRVGVSLLTNVGLAELIAADSEGYARIAVELARNHPRLRGLHSTLRQQMEQSPLMDAPRFARDIEAIYRKVWRKWCTGIGTPVTAFRDVVCG